MRNNFLCNDISNYKLFCVAGKFGIISWCDRLIFAPRCITPPNINELEHGYTFIELEDGHNVINTEGSLFLNEQMKDVGWFIQNQIVAFMRHDGTEGLYFLRKDRYVYGLTDAEPNTEYIETKNGKKHGAVTYLGKEIFRPNYSAVAIFDSNIYIAYNDDGTALLNSPEWKNPTKPVLTDSFFRSRFHGIMANFVEDGYQWLDTQTGEYVLEKNWTVQQKLIIKTAIEKEKMQK